ncbi:hypothetical protein AAG570_011048 [Ranatra chinensis]|uniref:Leucine-rich repeat-containing protein 57 n=1 Tax=Ranatra chinensis TaxID=642074 RepID=A0ABD0YJG5_9HEMI
MGNTALKKHYATAEKTGVLNVSQSGLDDLPLQLLRLNKILRSLDLSANKLSCLPPTIGSFDALKSLVIDRNMLLDLPPEIGRLSKLEQFSATNNRIRTLPSELSRLANLKRVNLSNNEIEEFPTALCSLKHLDALLLASNRITSIPKAASNLAATELDLDRNRVATIADDIADCPRLKILRLEENCLRLNAIPIRLLTESKLSTLTVDGNLFDSKSFMNMEGYDKYMERYTAVKKKMF